ncbi:MAG: uracil-DNA glycosylase [Gammaproteobacteria bacterium]|nr:uracil-DNA glycosylase [Gammaproteobacteria bacterium]
MGMDARQQHYLKAMGITAWVRRELPDEEAPVQESLATVAAPQLSEADPAPRPRPAVRSKETTPAPEPNIPAADEPAPLPQLDITHMDWEALARGVSECQQCDLHKTRMNAVLGVGNARAQWMFIGEAPGVDEDRQGEPFVGRAGQLLNEMLKAVGISRESVYIANILKCRPPNNRDPQPHEVSACHAYLRRQIELVQPKLIIALGRVAAQNLLHSEQSMGNLRGEVHHYEETGTPLIATYHPSYLLRSPGEKRKSWQDLKLALSVCNPTEAGA